MEIEDKKKHDPTVTFRCPQELVDGMWDLVPLLRQLPEYKAAQMSRSFLMRLAVAHGLERLKEILSSKLDDTSQLDLLESKQETLEK